MDFRHTYADRAYADACARLEFPGTCHLAYRDLPAIIGARVSGRRAASERVEQIYEDIYHSTHASAVEETSARDANDALNSRLPRASRARPEVQRVIGDPRTTSPNVVRGFVRPRVYFGLVGFLIGAIQTGLDYMEYRRGIEEDCRRGVSCA